jgi:hypothetical protein
VPTATGGAIELRFFDTSAVVKLYLQEEHSDRMRGWRTPGGSVVSRLTEVEVSSAFSRGVRAGVLSAAHADRAHASFRADLGRWDVMEPTRRAPSAYRSSPAEHPRDQPACGSMGCATDTVGSG